METSALPPPPYSVQPQQPPIHAPLPLRNGFAEAHLTSQPDYQYAQPPPDAAMQQQNYIQSPQGYPTHQPVQGGILQQPFHHDISNTTHRPPTHQHAPQLQQPVPDLPPDKLQLYQQATHHTIALQQSLAPPFPQPPLPYTSPAPPQPTTIPSPTDHLKTAPVKRFLGDTLLGRLARSSLQTATSTLTLPTSLSPWGDNNPVTLPNVRYRDAILFTTFAFVGAPLVDGLSDGVTSALGADNFIAEIVSSGADTVVNNTVVKYGVFQLVEQAIDKGVVERLLPEEERMLVTSGVKSLQTGVRHKLMGVDADLRFWGVYPSADVQACEKGWFCPYLFASARTPCVPRERDFGVCEFFGPFLGGDYLLARKLLAESTHALALCEADPDVDVGTNRMVVLFTGIAPYRANMWSTSRRPGCGTTIFHLLDGCPALVLPVTSRAPICAWSPWTLSQMRAAQYGMGMGVDGGVGGGYRPEWQHEQLCEYLDTIISVPHLRDSVRGRYVEVLGRMVSLVINGALALEQCRPILGKLDPERAGIVMFRY